MQPLWDHQQRGLDQIGGLLSAGERRICVAAPTGSGKSRMMFESIARADGPVSLYTDRRMLFDQICRGLDDASIAYGMVAAGRRPAVTRNVQVCMVQTAASRHLKGDATINPAALVLIDEAHKNAARQMKGLIDRHTDAVNDVAIIGYTATPLGVGHVYDQLVQPCTVSELRQRGVLVPAVHYGPDEPDQKWIGTIKVEGGECGIPNGKRGLYAKRVFGSVIDNYRRHNDGSRPAMLFAPGVDESLWFAEQLTAAGIPAAHIDGTNCWVDGQLYVSDRAARDEIIGRLRDGSIKCISNRFVLREGIDIPEVSHLIFATVFGSLSTYLQSGGRGLRGCPAIGKKDCIIQDHGGNWHRFGSLNEDREWVLSLDNRIAANLREDRLRERQEPEPVMCPNCTAVRRPSPVCPFCDYRHVGRSRMVMQADGKLKAMDGRKYPPRRLAKRTRNLERDWAARVRQVRNSKKASVRRMTFRQLETTFAMDHNWRYPPRDLPGMPVHAIDMYRQVCAVAEDRLRK